MLGYHPQVILAGRRINDGMGQFVGEQTVKQMIAHDLPVKGADIIVLGMTFKENCRDLRNSKVIDVVREFQSYGCRVHIHDPIADAEECRHEYGIGLTEWDDLPKASALIAAVSHKHYMDMGVAALATKLAPGGIFTDVKSAYDPDAIRATGARLWRL
jgi:UDP-N-acetyl-D-galactosamine dehydrogenase